jgi:hypothetical protein
MAELEQVLGGGPRRATVVDADAGRSVARRPVRDHQRQAALLDDVETAVVGDVAVGDEAVDERRAREVGLLRGAGNEGEADPFLLAHRRDALEEEHGRRVGERVRQRVVEDQPQCADATTAQRRGHRVRPGVAELLRLGEDPPAKVGAELLGTVVGVGHRHPRHTERLGDGGERHPLGLTGRAGGSLTPARHRG